MDTSKATLMSSKSGIQLFCPLGKVQKQPDGTVWAMGWGSVSDYRDDQNEIVDPAAMRAAVAEWAPWGNIRLQHDAARPIGVCPEGNWEIKPHPETGTDALWLNAHIVEPTAIKLLEEGVLKGFSIGGVCLERAPENVVDDDGTAKRAYRLKRFKLSEISLVDKPACDLATVERVELAKRSVREEENAMGGKIDDMPMRIAADEVGVLRKLFSRIFGQRERAEPEPQTEACATEIQANDEGRPAAEGTRECRPAGEVENAAGRPLAKSLGAIAFLAQKLAAWDADIEAMNAVASALGYEAAQERDGSDASARMFEAIDEFREVRVRLGHVMAEIAQEEAGEIADGTEEENDIVMNAAKVLKAINEAAQEGAVLKSGREISAANAEHLAKCGSHLDRAMHHHAQIATHLDALHKCYKAAGAGIDEAAEHLAQGQEHHDAIGEHQELAQLHLAKVGSHDQGAGPDMVDSEPEGSTEDMTVDDMVAAAFGVGDLRKRGSGRLFSEMISLIRKNAQLEARLAALDSTPARPKARLFALHKGDESRALVEQGGERSPESLDPNDRDAFRKSYRAVFANPRSVRDPMFKGSAGGAL
jgi:phage head maturation protease